VSDNFEKAGELKDLLNSREKENLCPLACFSNTAQRRRKEEFAANEYRQDFSADADRILNSMAYTRYIDKTQVFALINNDHLTHRVIHVQLVSRIARTIGRYLGLNEDLIEAASLGHDIGHTPFGHDGEQFLSKLTKKHGAGYFHHNLQSIQFLDKIERKGQGWNLSLQTMDAIICHDGEVHSKTLIPQKNRTFEDFDQIMERLRHKKACNEIPMTMEGCVVRMADTISYIGRDLEDAIRLGIVKREDIPEICGEILGQTNGTIVYSLVTDLISNSQVFNNQTPDNIDQAFIGFSDNISSALKELKAFNYKYIYKNPIIKMHLSSIEDIFIYLFEKYMNELENKNEQSIIFTDFLNGMSLEYQEKHSDPEIVRDYISGMTDSHFIRQAPDHLKPNSIENV
jgi:dGTPase